MNRNKLKKGNIGNKNFTQKVMFFITSGVILPLAIITILIGFTNVAFAQSPLSVTFTPNPLFEQGNFLPVDEATGTVEVDNLGSEPQTVIAEAVNVLDPDNLSSQFHLLITKASGGTALFDGSFNTFLTGGERVLSVLSGPGSETYTFIVTFNNIDDDNSDVDSYQGKTLGFDVCVGFQGGDSHCGDTVIGGEDGDGGGGSISGSGSGSIVLTIFNEQALNISNVDDSGSATITWNTNKLATSQVIYGPVPPAPIPVPYTFPYSLALIPPNFGYPLYTTEDSTKVINHSVPLTGLLTGETYVYRVVSRASPPTVSPEHQFTVPLLAQADAGAVLGASAEGTGNSEPVSAGSVLGETFSDTKEAPGLSENLAAVFASGFGDILSICTLIALLILLIIYLIWRIWLRKEYEKNLVAEEEIKNRFYLFFGGSSLLAILICVALNEYCPLPVFVIAFLVSLCFYLYRKFKIE